MAKKKEIMVSVPVSWGGMSINDPTGRIAVATSRSNLSKDAAEKTFLAKRVTATIVCVPGNDNPDQPTLTKTVEEEMKLVFDVKSFTVKKGQITFSASFQAKDVSPDQLAKFPGRAGRIEVLETDDIDGEDD